MNNFIQFLSNRINTEKELEKNLRWYGFMQVIESTRGDSRIPDQGLIRILHRGLIKDSLRFAEIWKYDWPRICQWHIQSVFNIVRKLGKSETLETIFARVLWKMKKESIADEYMRPGLPILWFSDHWLSCFKKFEMQEEKEHNRTQEFLPKLIAARKFVDIKIASEVENFENGNLGIYAGMVWKAISTDRLTEFEISERSNASLEMVVLWTNVFYRVGLVSVNGTALVEPYFFKLPTFEGDTLSIAARKSDGVNETH